MKNQVVLSDYQLSFYANTTHVSLHKLQFKLSVRGHVEKAIKEVFDQLNEKSKKPEAKIPYSIYPEIAKAVKKYNKKHESDFLVLYYKHTPIGIIKEDIPKSMLICPECKLAIIPKKQKNNLTWWQKAVRLFFRSAYSSLFDLPEYVCKRHGKVVPVMLSV